jgi:hypothetical protein
VNDAMTMYAIYIMRRTQIYLSEEQGRLLERRSKETGDSISQLIRSAIDEAYSRPHAASRIDRVQIARRTAGTWRDFPESGSEYVARLRSGSRLTRRRGR